MTRRPGGADVLGSDYGYFRTLRCSPAKVRSILASLSEADVRAGNALVSKVRIYPLSKPANPPAQRLLDMTEVMYNGLVKYDETFFTSLARVLNEETVEPGDLKMMGMLLPLGIERGKEFKPDAATVPQLKAAAQEAQAWLINGLVTTSQPVVHPRRLDERHQDRSRSEMVPVVAPIWPGEGGLG